MNKAQKEEWKAFRKFFHTKDSDGARDYVGFYIANKGLKICPTVEKFGADGFALLAYNAVTGDPLIDNQGDLAWARFFSESELEKWEKQNGLEDRDASAINKIFEFLLS